MARRQTDIVTVKLFDSNGKCRFITPIKSVYKTDKATGTTTWTQAAKGTLTIVFTAHKPTTIRYGTLQSEKLQTCFPSRSVVARLPGVDNVYLGQGSSLTMNFGGSTGSQPLLNLV